MRCKCHSAKCHYAECHDLFIVMPNIFMLSVILVNAVMPAVVMLSVVAPFKFEGSTPATAVSGKKIITAKKISVQKGFENIHPNFFPKSEKTELH